MDPNKFKNSPMSRRDFLRFTAKDALDKACEAVDPIANIVHDLNTEAEVDRTEFFRRTAARTVGIRQWLGRE